MIETAVKPQQQKITFNKKDVSDFYPVLRKRVDQYFADNNLSKHANSYMIAKTVFILTVFLATYFLIISNTLSPLVMLLLAGVHGFFTALIGVNIAHDGVHGAYAKSAKANRIIGAIFNVVGANDYVWKLKHNIIHHTYTNIPDHDEDIQQTFLIRINPEQKRLWVHKFQHIYVLMLYPFATLSWVLTKDFKNFFKLSAEGKFKHPKIEIYRLFLFKAFYYSVYLVLPMIFMDVPWYYVIIGFVFLHAVEGLTLAMIFMLAHVIDETSFPTPDKDGIIAKNWAAHQMYTTANFAADSHLATFVCGGLNQQIEHHLFPKICHAHYRNLAPIVRETAKEFGLPYIEHPTFLSALSSHLRFMKKSGRAETTFA